MTAPYYEVGSIQIFHCKFEEAPRIECDLIVTDPPYGAHLSVGKLNRVRGSAPYEWHSVEGHGGVNVPLLLSYEVPTAIFGANFFSDKLPAHGSPVELCWTNYLRNIRMFRRNYRGFMTRSDPKVHPMQKPVALMSWIFSLEETPDGVVFDPYMGSGSVLVAAQREGRPAVGVEVEESYCEAAAKRLSQRSILEL